MVNFKLKDFSKLENQIFISSDPDNIENKEELKPNKDVQEYQIENN